MGGKTKKKKKLIHVWRIYAATVGTRDPGGELTLNHKRPHWRRGRPRGEGLREQKRQFWGKVLGARGRSEQGAEGEGRG